tara:strand:+ start:254 stop:667 length:414 start_codon:yes stop_codon:yes gene_type:complete
MIAKVFGADLYLNTEIDEDIDLLVPPYKRFNLTAEPFIGGEGNKSPKKTLSAKLSSNGEDLEANVILAFVPKTESDNGVDVKFTPEGESNWLKIKEIKVNVAYSLHRQLYFGGEGVGNPIVVNYSEDNMIRIRDLRR